jgi:predicted dehydrogenase
MSPPAPVRFGLIGTGWRGQFYLRLAKAAADRLKVVSTLAETPTLAKATSARWRVAASSKLDELLAAKPEFVVVAVPRQAAPELTVALVKRGLPVLCETPPAVDLDGLAKLWAAVGESGLVQVAEQYPRMPAHLAWLGLAARQLIGNVTSVETASTHDYHAVAMMRAFLGAGFEPACVNARQFASLVVDPLGPAGWEADAAPRPVRTTIATIDFAGHGSGLYNFVDNQWGNPLRQDRLVVRGELGEVVDNTVTRWLPGEGPVRSTLVARRAGIGPNLEGNGLVALQLDGQVVYRNPWLAARLSEDDQAVANQLLAMGAWVRGQAPPPYPLAHGCQDQALALAIGRSAALKQDVEVPAGPWAEWPEPPYFGPAEPQPTGPAAKGPPSLETKAVQHNKSKGQQL